MFDDSFLALCVCCLSLTCPCLYLSCSLIMWSFHTMGLIFDKHFSPWWMMRGSYVLEEYRFLVITFLVAFLAIMTANLLFPSNALLNFRVKPQYKPR